MQGRGNLLYEMSIQLNLETNSWTTAGQAKDISLKFYEEAVIESEARTVVVQLKSEA